MAINEAAYGSSERAEWVRNQRCYVTGRTGTPGDPVVNSHIETGGTGIKSGPENIVPMLLSLEREYHAIGKLSFQAKHGCNLKILAKLCEARWQKHLKRQSTRSD